MSTPAPRPLRILALSGSLRRGSHHTALLRAAAELAPAGVRIEPYDLRDVPLYDADEDRDGGPPPVRALKAAVAAADAVLIATPEYNYGMPGVLKNALDQASRPAWRSPFAGKPVAVLSASPGSYGGARAQAQVKTTLLALLAEPYPAPELALPAIHTRMADGRLADAETRQRLADFVAGFAAWVRRRADAEEGRADAGPSSAAA